MKIVKPSAEITSSSDELAIVRHLERCGRTCYRSEGRITEDSAKPFVKRIRDRHHGGVLEHALITVHFVIDRGVSHELVRHRLASYCQESTRFCNYSKEKFGHEISVIKPFYLEGNPRETAAWEESCRTAEDAYFRMLEQGATPQEARCVLPTCLKTEVDMSANPREWRRFFWQRTSMDAHPQMREVAVPLLHEFQERFPSLFDDIRPDLGKEWQVRMKETREMLERALELTGDPEALELLQTAMDTLGDLKEDLMVMEPV